MDYNLHLNCRHPVKMTRKDKESEATENEDDNVSLMESEGIFPDWDFPAIRPGKRRKSLAFQLLHSKR